MTRKGTFIINGTERVVVSQLVRSPGVYFDRTLDKTSDVDVYGVKVIPSRGAWLEFDIDKRATVGVRIDRKRRQPVTVLLKALGWTDGPHPRALLAGPRRCSPPSRRTTSPPPTRRCSTSTASCARASRRRASPRRRCWRTCSSTPSATTWPRSAATRSTRSSGVDVADRAPARSPRTTSSAPSSTSSGCTPAKRATRSTTSTTSATGGCARSAS